MPAVGINNKSILFGDFSKYKIRQVRSMNFLRLQERYIDALQIGLMGWARYDGNLVDAGTHPVKYLQGNAS
jgi:HK97 family phage major capsid protein